MSEVENPVETVIRLLGKNMRVVKEDDSLASILISKEWYRRELFKNADGQVTVGLAETLDNKVEMSGRLRRRFGTLGVNVWTVNKEGSSDSGVLMRQKICEEINRIVRQNRNKPNETEYNFVGLGYPTGNPHKAFSAASSSELVPNDASWMELSSSDYEKLWYSDDERFIESTSVNGEYALMLFRFKIESREKTIKTMVLTFEGSGSAPASNGFDVKVWNCVSEQWDLGQINPTSAEETVTLTISSSVTNYVDDNGYVWLLARTISTSNGVTEAILNCDVCYCTVTVNGITYVDVVSSRDLDRVDTSPFVYRTEFVLRSWFFENVG